MFAKLLKHEFKSQAKLFLILSLAALGAGAVGGGMLALFAHLIQTEVETAGAVIGLVFSVMTMIFMLLAIVAYVYAMMILLIYRFYKYHFSDEGYLTFTLPASTHQILLSSALNILIWQVIASIVSFISVALIIAPFMAMMSQELGLSELIFSEIFLDMMYTFDAVGLSPWYFVLQIFAMIFTYIGSVILILLSITIGCVISKKYKVLASIGIYCGINMVMSIITGIVSFVSAMGSVLGSNATGIGAMYTTMAVPAVLYLIIGIGGYFLMHHLADKKLNLP